MFLTENTTMRYSNSAADPSDLYEAILEANEEYHNICMKMVKCEHHCIVNEDTVMLREAEEAANKSLEKSKENLLQTILRKIREFGGWLRKKLSNIGNALRKIPSTISGKIKGNKKKIEKAAKDSETVAKANSVEDAKDVAANSTSSVSSDGYKMSDAEKEKWSTMDSYGESYNFLTEAEQASEEVEAKSALTKAKEAFANLRKTLLKLNVFGNEAKKASKEGSSEESHKKVSRIGRILSGIFNALKTAVGVILGVIVAIAKLPKKGIDKVRDRKRNANPANGDWSTQDYVPESVSILDLFN